MLMKLDSRSLARSLYMFTLTDWHSLRMSL